MLDSLALLIEEEIYYFGSPDAYQAGSLLVSDQIIIEGRGDRAQTMRRIALPDWQRLRLDRLAAVPQEDWECLRCKVLKEKDAIAILKQQESDQFKYYEQQFRDKLENRKPVHVAGVN